MKALLRGLFVAVIILVLTAQMIRSGRTSVPGDRLAELTARLQRLDIETKPGPGSDMLAGRTPHCAQPIYATPLRIDGAEDETVRFLRTPEFVTRFVYLGEQYPAPATATAISRYAWATVLFHAGLRPHRPSPHLVFVALPQDCPALANLDWASLSP